MPYRYSLSNIYERKKFAGAVEVDGVGYLNDMADFNHMPDIDRVCNVYRICDVYRMCYINGITDTDGVADCDGVSDHDRMRDADTIPDADRIADSRRASRLRRHADSCGIAERNRNTVCFSLRRVCDGGRNDRSDTDRKNDSECYKTFIHSSYDCEFTMPTKSASTMKRALLPERTSQVVRVSLGLAVGERSITVSPASTLRTEVTV